jgi:hypothetical protein
VLLTRDSRNRATVDDTGPVCTEGGRARGFVSGLFLFVSRVDNPDPPQKVTTGHDCT